MVDLHYGTIAVVEDDTVCAALLEQLCRRFGFIPDIYGSAEHFLGANKLPVCVAAVVDFHLPGISGAELVTSIRASHTNELRIPVIMVSGDPDPSVRASSLASGADDLLIKPFAPDELRRLLLRLLYQPDKPNLNLIREVSS